MACADWLSEAVLPLAPRRCLRGSCRTGLPSARRTVAQAKGAHGAARRAGCASRESDVSGTRRVAASARCSSPWQRPARPPCPAPPRAARTARDATPARRGRRRRRAPLAPGSAGPARRSRSRVCDASRTERRRGSAPLAPLREAPPAPLRCRGRRQPTQRGAPRRTPRDARSSRTRAPAPRRRTAITVCIIRGGLGISSSVRSDPRHVGR